MAMVASSLCGVLLPHTTLDPHTTLKPVMVLLPHTTFDPQTTLVPESTVEPQTTFEPQTTLLPQTTFAASTICTWPVMVLYCTAGDWAFCEASRVSVLFNAAHASR